MIKRKKLRRNPELQGIAKEILSEVDDWEYLSAGYYGETYYFIIDSPLKINGIELQSGEYILKIEKRDYLRPEQREYLKKLSDLKLIPKIYYIDNKIQIMKYIEGKTIASIFTKYKINKKFHINHKKILSNFEKLLRKWHDLGYGHGDLNDTNILVDKDLNVHFIDPRIDVEVLINDFKNFKKFNMSYDDDSIESLERDWEIINNAQKT